MGLIMKIFPLDCSVFMSFGNFSLTGRLKQAEARAPERGVHAASPLASTMLIGSLTNSILRIYTGFELAHWLGPEASKNPNRIRRNHWHRSEEHTSELQSPMYLV